MGSNWTCAQGCDKPLWAHRLYGTDDVNDGLACPPTREEVAAQPRECCGRPANNMRDDEERECSNGECVGFWCQCGTFTGASAGPVWCGCEYDRGEVPTMRDDTAASADDDLT